MMSSVHGMGNRSTSDGNGPEYIDIITEEPLVYGVRINGGVESQGGSHHYHIRTISMRIAIEVIKNQMDLRYIPIDYCSIPIMSIEIDPDFVKGAQEKKVQEVEPLDSFLDKAEGADTENDKRLRRKLYVSIVNTFIKKVVDNPNHYGSLTVDEIKMIWKRVQEDPRHHSLDGQKTLNMLDFKELKPTKVYKEKRRIRDIAIKVASGSAIVLIAMILIRKWVLRKKTPVTPPFLVPFRELIPMKNRVSRLL